MDEFDNNTTPMDESHETPETHAEQHVAGSSRRTFLKAAVVGSAAAVAVSGAGVATLKMTGHHTGLTKFLVLGDTISGITESACTTKSNDTKSTPPDTYNSETIFFWFKFNAVPKGTYYFDVSPEPGSSGAPVYLSSSGASAVQVVAYANGASFTCNPPSNPTSGFVAQQSTLPVSFTTTSDGDVLLWLHTKGNTTGTNLQVTATLYQGTPPSGTAVGSATATFTLT